MLDGCRHRSVDEIVGNGIVHPHGDQSGQDAGPAETVLDLAFQGIDIIPGAEPGSGDEVRRHELGEPLKRPYIASGAGHGDIDHTAPADAGDGTEGAADTGAANA